MVAVPILEKNIHQTMDWLYTIEEECDWEEENQRKAFAALRVVLHELRDLLPVENAIHLSAQLPLIIRGLFFENWSTHSSRPKIRKKEDLLACIEEGLYSYPEIDGEEVIRGVLRVLSDKVSEGEWRKVIAVLPSDIKDLLE
jgi:uncharacterized protein (DUF2267 family)